MKNLVKMVVGTVVVVLLAILVLSNGDIHLQFGETLGALTGLNPDHIANLVVWDIRMPNVVAALITGSCLAVSGLLLQVLTGNPLADSSILGINAGASLGAVILMGLGISTVWLPMAVVLGAFVSLLVIGYFAQHNSPNLILLGGIALTAVLNGVILLVELRINQFDFDKILVWLSGSFWNLQMAFLNAYGLAAVVLILVVWLLYRGLDVLSLGVEGALSQGLNVRRYRQVAVAMAIALAGIAVSVGGAISFVGLMAPNIARKAVGSQMKILVPMTIVVGLGIMLLATLVANNLFLPSVLPVGLVVAVITMPYFGYRLFK